MTKPLSIGSLTAWLAAPLLVLGLFVSPAPAQEISEAHLDAAKRMLQATRTTRPLDNILPQVATATKAALIQNRPDLEAEITEIVDNSAIELAPRRGDLEQEIANMHALAFTIEELDAISEFFETETGTMLLAKTPLLQREIDRAARVWSTGLTRDLAQKVREKMVEAGYQ